jgi:hypothetical protein
VFDELVRRGRDRWAERWQECHARLSQRNCTADAHHPHLTPVRCESRICPWCARRAAARQVEQLTALLEQLNQAGAFTRRPSRSFKMLTLTLKPSGDSRADFRRLSAGWRALQKAVGFEKDKRDKSFGALAALELGPRRNPHLHVLYWGRYVPQAVLAEQWQRITGDSYVVEIHELRGSWRHAAQEVCKYVTKLAGEANWASSRDNDPCVPEVLLVDLLEALAGRRRIATYGVFYGVPLPEQLELVCQHCGATLSYIGSFCVEDLPPLLLLEWLERILAAPPREAAA